MMAILITLTPSVCTLQMWWKRHFLRKKKKDHLFPRFQLSFNQFFFGHVCVCLAISNATTVVKAKFRFSNMAFIHRVFLKSTAKLPIQCIVTSTLQMLFVFEFRKVFKNIFQITCRLSLNFLDTFASIIVLVNTNPKQKTSAVSATCSLNSENEY